MKKVTVVVLNYKHKDQTIDCVKSVLKSSYKNVEVIVVNNGSDNGLADEIKRIPKVIFIQNDENLGYSGGNNIGVKKALAGGADYILIINPDTIIDSQAISNLVNGVEKNSASIVGPKILFDDKKTIWYAGGWLDLDNVLGKHRGVDEKDIGQYDNTEETEFVSGGAIFIKREVFEKIGLFDDRYFLYLEDSDFCFRAKQAGFKIFYVPQAVVYHKNAQSTGLGSSLQDYYISRNRMVFAAKFLSLRTRFALFREAVKNVAIPSRRLALIDFMLGHLGKGSF